jgi:hypothetical protein
MQNAFPLTLTVATRATPSLARTIQVHNGVVATAGWAVHESSGSISDAAFGSNP